VYNVYINKINNGRHKPRPQRTKTAENSVTFYTDSIQMHNCCVQLAV